MKKHMYMNCVPFKTHTKGQCVNSHIHDKLHKKKAVFTAQNFFKQFSYCQQTKLVGGNNFTEQKMKVKTMVVLVTLGVKIKLI